MANRVRAGARREVLIALFDDGCLVCNRLVGFVVANDPAATVRFAALGSAAASVAAAPLGGLPHVDSIVVIDGDGLHVRSNAVRRLLAVLRPPWPWIGTALRVIPPSVADRLYDLVARNRARWFGRTPQCLVPDGIQRERFLSAPHG
jgi:predicted DCC family thiol-disulfide oxidoreductase YuxK